MRSFLWNLRSRRPRQAHNHINRFCFFQCKFISLNLLILTPPSMNHWYCVVMFVFCPYLLFVHTSLCAFKLYCTLICLSFSIQQACFRSLPCNLYVFYSVMLYFVIFNDRVEINLTRKCEKNNESLLSISGFFSSIFFFSWELSLLNREFH